MNNNTAFTKNFPEMNNPQGNVMPNHENMYNQTQKKKGNFSRNLSSLIPSMKVSMFILVILQIIILYFFINPLNLFQQLSVVQIINEVSKLTQVPPTEIPSVVAVIGDGTNLPNIDTIKSQNSVNAEVYKDAQNGDYVLAYTNKMIIFRKSTDTIIYNGDSPVKIQNDQQTALAGAIEKIAKDNSIISNDNNETPQLSVITDVSKLQGTNAAFYANAAKDDIVAIFPIASKIVIYRPASNELINSGDYTFIIK